MAIAPIVGPLAHGYCTDSRSINTWLLHRCTEQSGFEKYDHFWIMCI